MLLFVMKNWKFIPTVIYFIKYQTIDFKIKGKTKQNKKMLYQIAFLVQITTWIFPSKPFFSQHIIECNNAVKMCIVL